MNKVTRRQGVKPHRAILSVAFTSEEFQEVTGAAERGGMLVSAWVRQTALERARGVTVRLA